MTTTRLPSLSRRWLYVAGAALLLLLAGVVGSRALGNRAGAGTTTGAATAAPGRQATAVAGGSPTVAVTAEPFVVATANGRVLNVRSNAGMSYDVIGTVPNGVTVQVFGIPVQADGYTWVHIRSGSLDGWCVKEALRKP